MKELEKIYKRNKELDEVFISKYENKEPYYLEKNCLAFLIELGEFVNETKCFKYWTVKKPKRESVLEEYADCITMILTLFSTLNMDLKLDLEKHYDSDNVLFVINYLYQQGSKLMTKISEELLRDIMVNLLYVAELLDFEEEEIIEALHKKQAIIEERLNSEY